MNSLRLTGCFLLVPAIALSLWSGPADAALGDVLHTIPCPGANPADLAWVDGVLYSVIFSPSEERGIYCLDPETGDVLGTVPYAGTMPQGLTYDGCNLWQVCLSGDRVYKMDPLTGAVRDSFAAPGGENGQPIGLGWDGESLWLDDSRDPEKIWQLDTLGTVQGQMPAPGNSPYGLAWACDYIWVSDNNVGGVAHIYKMDPQTGEIVDSFPCPDGGGSPNGITHDGEYLWIAVNTTDTIYKVDDGIGGAAVEDEPLAASSLQLLMARADAGNRTVIVGFALDEAGEVHAQLFDVLGRQSAEAIVHPRTPGRHEMHLAGPRTSGIYYVLLRTGRASQFCKVMVAH